MDRHTTLARYVYYQGPQKLGDLWTLTRGALTMRCALVTHAHGWEIKLTAGSGFSRVEVCKSQREVFDTSDAWRAEATSKGWR
jgi:hypothetical protein